MTRKIVNKNSEIDELKDISLDNKPVKKYKKKMCKVLNYNTSLKELDVDFDGYGIRFYDVNEVKSDFVELQYQGEIGSSNFTYKL